MAKSRVQTGSIIEKLIAEGDLKSLAKCSTAENINALIGNQNKTPLIFAATLDKVPIVEFFLAHAGLNLFAHEQGSHLLQVVFNENGIDQNGKALLLSVLASNHFHVDSRETLSLINPIYEWVLRRFEDENLSDLFRTLKFFQGLDISREKNSVQYYLTKISLVDSISKLFSALGKKTAALQWFNLRAQFFNEMLLLHNAILETGAINLVSATPIMKCVVELFKRQEQDFSRYNDFTIECAAAYLCALKLGTLALHDKKNRWAGDEVYLHDAFEMAVNQDKASASSIMSMLTDKPRHIAHEPFTISAMDNAFLSTYTATHNRVAKTVCSEQRLSKQLDYLTLLQPAYALRSPEADAEFKKQADLMPKLLSWLIIDPNIQKEEYALEIVGLKNLYAIGVRQDLAAAAKAFERAAITHENASPNRAFNGFIMSAVTQFQMMTTTHQPGASKSAAQNALKSFRSLQQFDIKYFSLTYHVELFDLLFDFIAHCKDVTQKAAFSHLLFKNMVKLAYLPVELRDGIVNHVFEKLITSKILADNTQFTKTLKTLKECVIANDGANVFYKKFDLLASYPVGDKLLQAKRHYLVVKAKINACSATVDFDKKDYRYNISILTKAISNIELLSASAVAAQETINWKFYSRVFLMWGLLHREESEKYAGLKRAIELDNEFALHTLLRMQPRPEYEGTILRGLQHAILRDDSKSIQLINDYLLKHNFFSAKLQQLAKLALTALNDEGLVTAASKGFIPALFKLFVKHKKAGHMRRSLALSGLLLGELVLNKDSIQQDHHYSEASQAAMINHCMDYLGDNANTDYHQYLTLAAWYINFIAAAQTFIAANPDRQKIDVTRLMLYCANQDGFYNDVCSAMMQNFRTGDADIRFVGMTAIANEQRFFDFYRIMQKLHASERIIRLHMPDIVEQTTLGHFPNSNIEMVEPQPSRSNLDRSGLFAIRIAAIKLIDASPTDRKSKRMG